MENNFISENRHKSKVYLITGSSMGIGYAILKRLAQEGATVILTSRNEENLIEAENDLKESGIKSYIKIVANFNNKEERAKVFKLIEEKFGHLDGLVSNIAVNPYYGDTINIEEKEFDKIFSVNVFNTFFTIIEALPLLLKGSNYKEYLEGKISKDKNKKVNFKKNEISITNKTKHSSIIIISSQAAYTPFEKIGIYSASKTALLSMTKSLATELANFNCRVNCIAPGVIKTKFASAISDSVIAKNNFIRRAGIPEEIAGLAAYLLSEDASFITGETININGGLMGKL